jgi:hypothetical protein
VVPGSLAESGKSGILGIVEAKEVRRLVVKAFAASPFERVAAGRWRADTGELIWVFDLDRGRSWAAWSVMVGVVVREWHPELAALRHNNGDVMIDYSLLGSAVPPAAAGSRFDDHRSYFSMVFDHRHDLVGEEERAEAFAFMASDLAAIVGRLPAVADLRAAVAAGQFRSGFVCRQLLEGAAPVTPAR